MMYTAEKNEGRLRNMTSIYLRRGDEILLLCRTGSRVVADNSYVGSAGGHFEAEELDDAKACVLRELYEETGLQEKDITGLVLRYVTLRYKNGEIRQNYFFFADLKDEQQELESNEGRLEWFPLTAVSDLPMPFSAKYMMTHYISVGKDTTALYGGIATAAGVEFTEMKEF